MPEKPSRPRLAGKTVKLKEGRDRSLSRRHPWVFSGGVSSVPDRPAGSIVDVSNSDGQFIARGFYNPHSQILVRALTWDQSVTIDQDFFRSRILQALQLRKSLGSQSESNAWRLFNSESDGIPGLIVDQFADYLVVQSTTAGVDANLSEIVEILQSVCKPKGIIERSNDTNRKREGLELRDGLLVGKIPDSGAVDFLENSVKFRVNLQSGHKTGYYLDQKQNRKTIADFATGRDVLDTFCYSGGFSINALKAGAKSVVSVDSSQPALDLLRENLILNDMKNRAITTVCADVFTFLRDQRDRKAKFDLIILDPPKLAQSGAGITKAARAYQDLSRIGFELLRPGGYLATFSCSGHMSLDLFQKVIFAAANQAKTDAHLLQIMLQAPDHPVHLNIPESLYLKGFLCRKI